MTVGHRAIGPEPVAFRDEDPLPADGVLPPELDGCFLQSVPHPAAWPPPGGSGTATGPYTFAGVRLGGGSARWLRAGLRAHPDRPLGPVPALAPSVWLTGRPMTMARPVREAGSTLWHTIACHPGLGYAEHLVVGPGGDLLRATPFPLEGAPLMHAMALTRRFAVVLDLPVCHDDAAALVGLRFPYSWRPGRPARIGLIPRWRQGAEPQWFAIDPCYVFDTANAYDDGDRVVLDATAYPRAFDAARPDAGPPCLRRWTLDLRTGVARTHPLPAALVPGPLPGPLPGPVIVDDRVRGRRHRHLFGVTIGDGTALTGLDLRTGAVRRGRLDQGLMPGRPVFVPRAGRGAEGAGWLLVAADDPARGGGALLVFDALDPAAPRASVRLPVALPVGGPTTWLGGDRLPPGPSGDRSEDATRSLRNIA